MGIIALLIHGSDPLGDKEHALLYLYTYLAIFLTGAGKYSIDAKVF
jgi:putative oxidoreductase